MENTKLKSSSLQVFKSSSLQVFKSELGIDHNDAEHLKDLILNTLPKEEAKVNFEDKYGLRYTVDLKIRILNTESLLTTGWIVRSHEDFPRLTTCYLKS